MPELNVSGTSIHFQVLGKGSVSSSCTSSGTPSGTPVVMLHGLLVGNLASWYFTAAPAIAKKREVLTYDLRGHGLSGRPHEGYDLRTMVEDLREILDQKWGPTQKVSLVGHSYGALVALRFALLNPQRVESLVLVEAPLPPSKGAEIASFNAKTPEELLEALPPSLQGLIRAQKRQAVKFLERVQFLVFETELIKNLNLEGDVSDRDLMGCLLPTLLVYSEESALAPVGRRLARLMPNSKLEWIKGGHYLPSENPEELTGHIARFFQ